MYTRKMEKNKYGSSPLLAGLANTQSSSIGYGDRLPISAALRPIRRRPDRLLQCFRFALANPLKGNGTGDEQFETLEIHIRPFQRQQLARPQSSDNVQEHGCFARLLEMLEQRLELLDVQHDGNLLPLRALTHLRDWVSVVLLPANSVIEDCVH